MGHGSPPADSDHVERAPSPCPRSAGASGRRPKLALRRLAAGLPTLLALPAVHGAGGGPPALLAHPALLAQTPDLLELSFPNAESSRGYTRITGARGLSDGRVVVVDELERFVYLLGDQLSHLGTVGRHGQGPGEYESPGRIVPLEGDSTAVRTDRGYLIVTPQGEVEGRLPPERFFAGADRHGYLYGYSRESQAALSTLARIEEPELGSLTIVRWHKSSDPEGAEVVGAVPILNEPSLLAERIPFQPRPLWAVAPEGGLVVVHPEPYRVERIRIGGERLHGPAIDVEPVPVSEGHKERWRAERGAPRVVRVFGLVGDGPREARTEIRGLPTHEPLEWPDRLPPFLSGALSFDLGGTLWVERTTRAGARATFDLFDGEGRRVRRVLLPAGSRLVGFGEEAVYAVRRDEFDLEYLQRFTLR